MTAGGHLGFGFDLAPFYDVVCVGAYPDVDQALAMRIGRAGQWDAVERQDWLVLAGQMFPGRRIGAGIFARQLDWLKEAAAAALPAIDAAVTEGVATREEAKPIRDIVGSRIRHLNRTLKWDIPAETDAPIRRGGGLPCHDDPRPVPCDGKPSGGTRSPVSSGEELQGVACSPSPRLSHKSNAPAPDYHSLRIGPSTSP